MRKNVWAAWVMVMLTAAGWTASAFGQDTRSIIRRIEDIRHGSSAAGYFRALIIGINDYNDPKIEDLKTAVNDARAINEILVGKYGFATKLLLNAQASKSAMYNELRKLSSEAGPDDSVIIYYAGHGEIDRTYEEKYGWWIPADAKHGDELTYLDNVEIQKAMANTRARHVLLISDSCYAGTLFGDPTRSSLPPTITDRYYLERFTDQSRWGITSGNKTPVSDTGSMGHSIFASQLIKTLCRNDQTYISAYELFTRIAPIISNNAAQKPKCRPIDRTNDMGGEFVFIRKPADSNLKSCEPFPMLADSGGAVIQRPQTKPEPKPEPEKTTLTVTVDVSAASVWINGTDYGQTREFTIASPGTYTVKVTAPGYQPYQTAVDMKPGVSQEVKAYLEKIVAVQPITPVTPVSPPRHQKQISNSLGQTFVYIEPGEFTMGSPTNEPDRDSDEVQHKVTLTKGFYMQTTEVTQGQWKAVMGNNPSRFKECGDNCPVEQVSWDDVQGFIAKMNRRGEGTYRLPTEAEWEYAARAGTTTPFAFGSCLSTDQANYDGNNPFSGCSKGKYREKTIPVGSLQENAWGLYDMHGNVWEWCSDWYGDYLAGSVTDPTGPSTGSIRVLRGGSWSGNARSCRSAFRDSTFPSYRYSSLGFRLAFSPGR